MELESFIQETIENNVNGVVAAQKRIKDKEAQINPLEMQFREAGQWNNHNSGMPRSIDFDVRLYLPLLLRLRCRAPALHLCWLPLRTRLFDGSSSDFCRYTRWFSRSEHPEMFWSSMMFHALLCLVLLLSTLLAMRYSFKRDGEVESLFDVGGDATAKPQG